MAFATGGYELGASFNGGGAVLSSDRWSFTDKHDMGTCVAVCSGEVLVVGVALLCESGDVNTTTATEAGTGWNRKDFCDGMCDLWGLVWEDGVEGVMGTILVKAFTLQCAGINLIMAPQVKHNLSELPIEGSGSTMSQAAPANSRGEVG